MQVLEDLTVLDLSNLVPGALCTMILADMGAEVIKIEPPKPFPIADIGYSPDGEERRREASFWTLNRNKKSLAINLKAAEGKKVIYRLAEKADVLIEGYRPGVVERLGVDYKTISKINPNIIYCSLSGYGQDGPYRLYSGHDVNYISMTGALGAIGPADGPPSIPLNLIGDFGGASLYGTISILLAYLARQKTGKGQYIDHAYLDGALHMMTWFTQRYFYNGTVLKRGGSHLNGSFPYYGAYETKDGKYLSIGCVEPKFWENLMNALGNEEYTPLCWSAEDTYREPTEKQMEITAYLKKVFLTKTRDEWFDLLAPKDVPVGKVYSIDEVLSDPQILHRELVLEIDDPRVGKVKQVGIVPKLSETPGKIRWLAPILGEHTEEILLSHGYDRGEIDQLRKDGVIK